MSEACRKDFENLLNPVWSIDLDKDGKYKSKTVRSHWKTWEAAYNLRPSLTVYEIDKIINSYLTRGIGIGVTTAIAQAIFDAQNEKEKS